MNGSPIVVVDNNLPSNMDDVACILVQQKHDKGLFGVHVPGFPLVCPLPRGFDGYTALREHLGYILAVHPNMPQPMLCDPSKGTATPIDPSHIIALPGRSKLLTH